MKKLSGVLHDRKTIWLESDDFEYLCFDFTREYFSFKEPIPDYCTRNSSLLEAALGSPKQTFDGILLYPTLYKQAAILFYSLIKNHPFQNGNKRIAVMTLLAFFAINRKWLSIGPHRLYDLACAVSSSESDQKTKVLSLIERSVRNNLIDFNV